ncbi:MAG TPA: bifunctional (p)ppGpp synthetase/guanosine-3',5'-bis(diphosphate) 3'-pyrophosphohydrolase [Miltoncostaeales bacterium]|nr:bifunctional (p)ppGpp synthetase/guanosine-3',5'-bis(diphosphate) 3'-pyrophosphohydrolase [Miltoncostaeales bacterium]
MSEVAEQTRHDSETLDELIAELLRHHPDADVGAVRAAYAFAAKCHDGQLRRSGEAFITHPLGCASICAQLGLDGLAVQAALLHDTVEDTTASLEDVEEAFGSEVALLVDGVTKLSKIHFQSQAEHQAENYRKLIVSMSSDIRVLIVKLADRLHNMRTLSYMSKNKRIQKARETLEIYAPLAHRLGIHALKSELEDLAFGALHPRRFAEIQQLVNHRRADRDAFVAEAGAFLDRELQAVGIIPIEITGRAKHMYSIYEKMTRRGKEFNEIYDLTAMRVIVDSVNDCYGTVGIIHSLWKPMPGRFKDYVAMPKINGYQSLHTTVIGASGHPLEIQIRTPLMHRTAEYGVAAHWLYKKDGGFDPHRPAWVGRMMEWQKDTPDAGEFMDTLRSDLYADEVFVFTPKGEVRALASGATPIDFAYDVHTDVGHRTVGARVNGRIVPLSHPLLSGDIVEILTSKAPRGPSRDWLNLATTGKARSKIRGYFRKEQRIDAEHQGREMLHEQLRRAGLPNQKLVGSPLMLQVMQEMGFKKADEFYISIGSGRSSVQTAVNKVIARLKQGETVVEENRVSDLERRPVRSRSARPSTDLGLAVDGVPDVLVRLANCCKPVPGDDILGYISIGRGITVHREECPNAQALMKNPERFTHVSWVGPAKRSFNVEIAIDAWDRPRMLEDLSRTIGEAGANIVIAQCLVEDQMARTRFTLDLGDVEGMRHLISALRGVDGVVDAYRVTPGH